ncbi:MAG: dipicolinate synthase subunit B [Firmicutes bacterium]|nr:dipicolinate synthase subunit B [Bacillota bacterium]
MTKRRLGLALCGSYCTFERAFAAAEKLCEIYDVTPILSERAAVTDSRFGKAAEFKARLEAMTQKPVIDSVAAAEPLGPLGMLDALLIAPCTGNTLAKLAAGITDSSVTMAAKAQLRNGGPLIIAVSTNDGLSGTAPSLGRLLGRKNVYFVPFYQDDPAKKPTSLLADFDRIGETVEAALQGRQAQPVIGVRPATS